MRDVFLTNHRFPWDSLGSIIGGRSAIDIPRLRLTSLGDAGEFLRVYGFEWDRDRHRLEIELLRGESIAYIEEELLSGRPDLWIPPDIRSQRDVRELLLWASAADQSRHQLWSCAILRVMHTLAHARPYFESRHGVQVREQILARFTPHIYEKDGNVTLGEGDTAIPLASFEAKPGKPMRSVATKLLHKVENVASSVFDHVGVRFVTKERFDALLVVRYLRKKNVIMFANAMPSRSRNTLIDLDLVRSHLERVDAACARGELTDDERLDVMREAVAADPYPPGEPVKNTHSSFAYHSIQFTCRQQVRVPNAYAEEVNALLAALDGTPQALLPEVAALRKRAETDEEIHFFFPFEVQILDKQSYESSRSGQASHAEYKRRQRETVRRRVLGALLDT